jgi:hypothetical protein
MLVLASSHREEGTVNGHAMASVSTCRLPGFSAPSTSYLVKHGDVRFHTDLLYTRHTSDEARRCTERSNSQV